MLTAASAGRYDLLPGVIRHPLISNKKRGEVANSFDLHNSTLVVAHLDDEILWFSSILDKVDEVIVCFLASPTNVRWTQGRKKALAELPLDNLTCLEIDEAGVFNDHNWTQPVPTPFGIEIVRKDARRDQYQRNYSRVYEALKSRLSGVRTVITHNPWGEYGNEEHVQVFRAIDALRQEQGFDLWYSGYASNKSAPMMLKSLARPGRTYVTMATNEPLGRSIEAIYKKHDCWTWYDDWRWFETEAFLAPLEADRTAVQPGHDFPLNMIHVEPQPDQAGPLTPAEIIKAGIAKYAQRAKGWITTRARK